VLIAVKLKAWFIQIVVFNYIL